jgi:hypothetical protein
LFEPTMSVPDRDKLVKLLALLDSDQDAEAVAAGRKAAGLLRHAGLDWDEVVVLAPERGWRGFLNAWLGYAREMKRRVIAERAAEHWRALARLRQEELEGKRSTAGARAAAAPSVSGHALIDRLLASSGLDGARRARVEAIATWFRRTHVLTEAEQADLETFARQLEAAR